MSSSGQMPLPPSSGREYQAYYSSDFPHELLSELGHPSPQRHRRRVGEASNLSFLRPNPSETREDIGDEDGDNSRQFVLETSSFGQTNDPNVSWDSLSAEEIQNQLKGSNRCFYCPYENNCTRFLVAHIRGHSSRGRMYPCDLCPYVARKMSHLNAHMRTHTGEKPFGCTFCGKKFSMHHSLHYHVNTHKDLPEGYCCSFCTVKK